MTTWNTVALGALLVLFWVNGPSVADAKTRHEASARTHGHRHALVHLSRTAIRHAAARPGRMQEGKASVYATGLQEQRMADGTRFDPRSDAAASKTLPLGTTARVRNLRNGRAAVVRVRDRSPHRAERILDVSPGSAGALGIGHDGVAPVDIMPLTPPPPAKLE